MSYDYSQLQWPWNPAVCSLQKCPICEGRGCVPWDPRAPYATAGSSTGPYRCPTCKGARVLTTFGTADPSRVPPPGTYPNDPAP